MRRLLLIIPCLLLAACAQAPAEPVIGTPEEPLKPVTEAASGTGYIWWSEAISGWYLSHPNALDPLDFATMTNCITEVTGQPCTASGMIEGMQLAVRGYRDIRENGALHVETAKIIGTSLTLNLVGTTERQSDGSYRIRYEKKGEEKAMRIAYDAKTVCQDDGETKPCGSWINGRGGSVTGELRKDESILRATWIDLP